MRRTENSIDKLTRGMFRGLRNSIMTTGLVVGITAAYISGCGEKIIGCLNDYDCKADRVCVDGQCVSEGYMGNNISNNSGSTQPANSCEATVDFLYDCYETKGNGPLSFRDEGGPYQVMQCNSRIDEGCPELVDKYNKCIVDVCSYVGENEAQTQTEIRDGLIGCDCIIKEEVCGGNICGY